MKVICKYCKVEFNKTPYAINRTNGNNFCSQSCAAKFNNTIYIKKKERQKIACKNCGKIGAYTKYCSRSCWDKHRVANKIQLWLDGHDKGYLPNKKLKAPIRNYLLQQTNYSCSECGWNKIHPQGTSPLHIHHIDGHYYNCRPENLKVLCPNCHSLTDTFGARNKGNGRYS